MIKQPEHATPVGALFQFGYALANYIHDPRGLLVVVASALGFKWNYGSGSMDPYDVGIIVLLAVMALAALSFVLWALPRVYHVLFIWTACIIISLLTMSWCLNNHDPCISYYSNFEARSIRIHQWMYHQYVGFFGAYTAPVN
jgi:hypothetical protein